MLPAFRTSRLSVRQLALGDEAELAAISDHPNVSRWMSFMEGGFGLRGATALIGAQELNREFFFGVRVADGTLVGALGCIDHPDRSLEIGFWFGVEHQRKGYALEAVSGMLAVIKDTPELASRPLFAEARPDNAASLSLLGKLGFRATGRPGPRANRIELVLDR